MRFAELTVVSLMSVVMPVSAFAHDGHPAAGYSAAEFLHYLTPIHLVPFVSAAFIVMGVFIMVRSKSQKTVNNN